MGIRIRVKYVILAAAVLLTVFAFSAEAADFNLFGALPKTYTSCTKKNPRILFVGNSHTYKNNMPAMFRKLCNKRGIHPVIRTLASGGHSLYEYVFPKKGNTKQVRLSRRLKQLLKRKKWDYVVIQDRSYEAVVNPKKMKAAVKELDSLIKKAGGGKMVLYMTWAPEKNHASYRRYTRGLADDPDTYLAKVQKVYYKLAGKYHAALAPVGIAFRRAQKTLPGVPVIGEDGLHSSVQGAYLTACVLYATIFGKSPEGISYYPNGAGGSGRISAKTAAKLQKLAADVTVRGSRGMKKQPEKAVSGTVVQAGKNKKIE